MPIHAGFWSWVWIPFFFMFCVGPIIRLGVRAAQGGCYGPWEGNWDDSRRRRARGRWPKPDPDFEVELETRLAEIDQLQSRVNELENRLDFAERMLAQQRSPQVLDPMPVPVDGGLGAAARPH